MASTSRLITATVLVLGLPLTLRADHEEVQDHEHQDDGQEAHQGVALAGGSGGLGVGGSDHWGSPGGMS